MRGFQLPPCRPLALPFTDPSPSLGFALTNEPSSEHTELPKRADADEVLASLDERTLQQVAELLASTDVSYL